MITRRKLLLGLGLGTVWTAPPALAQQERRVRRIGYFSGSSAKGNETWLAACREGMAERHWVEVRDYVIDPRFGNGVASAFGTMADELIATRPDLLLVSGDTVARLLAERTKTIPI